MSKWYDRPQKTQIKLMGADVSSWFAALCGSSAASAFYTYRLWRRPAVASCRRRKGI